MVDATSEEKAQQSALFRKLVPGAPLTKVMSGIPYPITYMFDLEEGGVTYRYRRVENPATRAQFGLLFQDDRLIAILSGQAIMNQFYLCRAPYRLRTAHWSLRSFASIKQWIISNNRLGTDYEFNDSVLKNERTSSGNVAITTMEVIGYGPLFVLGAPVAAVASVFEDKEGEAERNRQRTAVENERRESRSKGLDLKIGTSLNEVEKVIGDRAKPTSIFKDNVSNLVQYDFRPTLLYGFRNDRLFLIESRAMTWPTLDTPRRYFIDSPADCKWMSSN